MEHLTLESQTSIKGGVGYFLRTADDLRILSADTLLCEIGGATRKIGISVSSGCRVGCRYCFTNKYHCYRQLSEREICEQVTFVLDKRTEIAHGSALKISLKQMGDPAINIKHVLNALKVLSRDYHDAMFVVSTSAPRIGADLFEGLQNLQDSGANVRLQFSCHTTSDSERASLSPNMPMMSLAEMGIVANQWSGQLVTLNFVIFDGYSYDIEALERTFNPSKVFIKINFIDWNSQTERNAFRNATESRKNAFVDDLLRAGYLLAHRHM